MSFYQRLLSETAAERAQFIAIPLIRHVMTEGADLPLYLDFLGQAYHHVKHTCPLLALAAARCGPADNIYRQALFGYIAEERGHEDWILDDIAALGGSSETVRLGQPRMPCKVMVSHAYYGIDRVSPYCLLGMVHVLEGMSAALASRAATVIRSSLRQDGESGFRYLTSHGALDLDHVQFFERLVEKIPDAAAQAAVIQSAKEFYQLYGDIFRDLGSHNGDGHAA